MKRTAVPGTGVVGPVRSGQDLPRLLRRLEPGDVAVLEQVDLDSATAAALVARGVAAVVNAAPSTSGRYPNLGPRVLLDAGVPLLDAVGDDVFGLVRDGRPARLDGDALWVGEREVARGVRHDETTVAVAAEQARAGLAAQLADLAANATGLLLDERDVLLEGVGVPRLTADLTGRHVVVVADAYDAEAELRLLRGYLREHRPVLIGVDGGADLLLRHGLRPDAAVGELSADVQRRARELVARAPAPVLERPVIPFRTTIDTYDMALLMADRGGAAVVVAVGAPTSTESVLDRGRTDSASALLVRLRTLDTVVGARAAAALSPVAFPWVPVVLLVLAVLGVGALAWSVSGGGFDLDLLRERWGELPW